MIRGALVAMLACVAACSSASSSSVESLPPDTVGADPGPNQVPTPSRTGEDLAPDPIMKPVPGCPAARKQDNEEPTTVIASADDLLPRVVGVYGTCIGERMGLELRVDADAKRIRWYQLDDRYVRVPGDSSSGWFEIGECSGATCTGSWYDETKMTPWTAELIIWTDPLGLEISASNAEGSMGWSREMLHVAK
jgi:hypothetical protein